MRADEAGVLAVGTLAAYSHLLADIVFSRGRGAPVWGVPLAWPFSNAVWAFPLVPWVDLGATLIFIGGMFAMFYWRAHARPLAIATLGMVIGYVSVRGRLPLPVG